MDFSKSGSAVCTACPSLAAASDAADADVGVVVGDLTVGNVVCGGGGGGVSGSLPACFIPPRVG